MSNKVKQVDFLTEIGIKTVIDGKASYFLGKSISSEERNGTVKFKLELIDGFVKASTVDDESNSFSLIPLTNVRNIIIEEEKVVIPEPKEEVVEAVSQEVEEITTIQPDEDEEADEELDALKKLAEAKPKKKK